MASSTKAIQAIDRASEAQIAALIQKSNQIPGFSELLFHHVRELLGSRPKRAMKLASLWKNSSSSPLSDPWALRLKSLHHRLNGEWIKSVNAARNASLQCSSGREQAIFQIGSIDALGRIGRVASAIRLADSLYHKLELEGDKVSAARVAINAGNALLWADRHEEAKVWFELATSRLSESGNPYEWSSALLGLSTIELLIGSADEANSLARQAADALNRLGLASYGAVATINEGHAFIMSGRAEDGLEILLKVRNSGELSPLDEARVEEFLGDAYLRLNMWHEASAAYRSALDHPGIRSSPLNRANARFGLAEAQLGTGNFLDCLHESREAEQQYSRIGNKAWAEVSRVVQSEAAFDKGDFHLSLTLSNGARKRLGRMRMVRHAARAEVIECMAKLELSKLRRKDISRLRTQIASSGAIDLAWKSDFLEASITKGPRRLSAFRAMFEKIIAQRGLTRSVSARTAFYRDKVAAIGTYIDFLLSKSTRTNLEEAIRALESTRSAALIDELTTARASKLDSSTSNHLNRLREEFARLTEDDVPGGPERRFSLQANDFSSLQRKWSEFAQMIGSSTHKEVGQQVGRCPIFTETSRALYAVFDQTSVRLPVSPNDLRQLLKWVHFELVGPRVEPKSNPCELYRLLAAVREAVIEPLRGFPIDRIVLDGVFWSVPWQIVDPESGTEKIVTSQIQGRRPLDSISTNSVMIWYQSRPDLPHIKREVDSFCNLFPDAIVCDSIEKVREAMFSGTYDLLHIATHAHYHRTNPMFSAFSFAGGMLPAVEIARAGFYVRNVTLAACDSGIIGKPTGYEIDGLTRSFLSRGARSILATQWSLNDAASAEFMQTMYENIATGIPLEDSVSNARACIRELHEHPYFWGAPYLVAGLELNQ